MNLLALDLEMNQPSGRIIQVGAVAFNGLTGEIVNWWSTYCDPEEPITPFITALTKITDHDTKGSLCVRDAYLMLQEFQRMHACAMNPVVWGSGTHNDSSTLHAQSGSAQPNYMGHRVVDAKTLWQSVRLRQGRGVRGGLNTAIRKAGLTWDDQFGGPHNALADAWNTARIWHCLVSSFKL